MALEGLVLDGLDIDDGSTYRLVESLDISPPPKRLLWIAGREGDILGDVPGSERRTVTFKVMVTGATMDTALTALGALTDKLQKAERTNGGISLVWTPSGSSYSKTIKVLAGEVTDLPLTPDALYFKSRPTVTVRLDCKPFLYGSETSYASVTSSAPHVVAMARSVAGDVAAEGRLILTDMATQERDFAEYGLDPDPVTMETLALSYTPSLFLRLGSSSGLTDQSGNGYNGTAQGGVTVGGYSTTLPLVGDDSTATDFDGSNDYISTGYGTRRNLCKNPRLATNTTGWAVNGSGGATVNLQTRDVDWPAYLAGVNPTLGQILGDYAYHAKVTGAGGTTNPFVPLGTDAQRVAIAAGQYLTSTVYANLISKGVGSIEIKINWFNSGGGFLSSSTGDAIAVGAQTRYKISALAPANTASADVYVYSNGLANGEVFEIYLGAVVHEITSAVVTSPDPFFDGSGYVNSSGTFVSDSGGKVGWLGTAHASASDKGALANGTVRTLAGWVNFDGANTNKTIFSNAAGGRAQLIVGAGNIQWSADGSEYDVVIATAPAAGGWHYVAVVFDEPNNSVKGYLDGSLDTTATHNAQFAAGDAFAISNPGSPFDGKMAHVGAWERGLTADQVKQLYQAGANPYLIDSAHLSTTGLSGSGNTRTGAYSSLGSGNTVLRVTTQTNWVGSCETGAIPHYGPFRAKARIWTDATDAQVRVAYKSGDAPFKRLNPIVLASGLASQWQEVDLGMLDIPQAVTGTQRTIVRIEVKSTTSNKTFDVDYLELIPATRYGKARAPFVIGTVPSAFAAASGFDTESGAITGDALPIGGVNWTVVTNSDTDDFSASGGLATRTAVSDTGTGSNVLAGRGVTAGTTTYTSIAASLDFKVSALNAGITISGILARVVDSSNYFTAYVDIDGTTARLFVNKTVATVTTSLATWQTPTIPVAADTWYTIRLILNAGGAWVTQFLTQAGSLLGELKNMDDDLKTGGTLATGKIGIVDFKPTATACTRTYDNAAFWVPDVDAAIFSGKTAEFRPDDTLRQSSADATIYGRPSIARGPGVFIPQAGSESKVTRIVAKACRNDIESNLPRDNIADSTKLQVYATPRYLVTPRT